MKHLKRQLRWPNPWIVNKGIPGCIVFLCKAQGAIRKRHHRGRGYLKLVTKTDNGVCPHKEMSPDKKIDWSLDKTLQLRPWPRKLQTTGQNKHASWKRLSFPHNEPASSLIDQEHFAWSGGKVDFIRIHQGRN